MSCYCCDQTPELKGRITPGIADQRVDRGFEVLDEKYGQEWVYKIDPLVLNVGDSNRCVGAQLEGSFGAFQAKFALFGSDVVRIGLDTFAADQEDLDNLKDAWIKKIDARKELLEA